MRIFFAGLRTDEHFLRIKEVRLWAGEKAPCGAGATGY